jgi:hypothetical protein
VWCPRDSPHNSGHQGCPEEAAPAGEPGPGAESRPKAGRPGVRASRLRRGARRRRGSPDGREFITELRGPDASRAAVVKEQTMRERILKGEYIYDILKLGDVLKGLGVAEK